MDWTSRAQYKFQLLSANRHKIDQMGELMEISNPGTHHDVWSILQEPARPGINSSSYMLLLSALDSGWEITEPVILHPGQSPDFKWVYQFDLQHPTIDLQCQLILEESPETNYFIYQERMVVKIV